MTENLKERGGNRMGRYTAKIKNLTDGTTSEIVSPETDLGKFVQLLRGYNSKGFYVLVIKDNKNNTVIMEA